MPNDRYASAYIALRTEATLWTTGFRDPDGEFQPESDHGSQAEAKRRATWLNGATSDHHYRRTEPGLWTSGYYDRTGKWHPEADHGSAEEAARAVVLLNGGTLPPELDDEDRTHLADLAKRPGPRRCVYVDLGSHTEHGYVPSLVTEGEPGHAPLTGRGDAAAPWYWGHDYAQAMRLAEQANAELGLSKAEVLAILLSSMRAGPPPRAQG